MADRSRTVLLVTRQSPCPRPSIYVPVWLFHDSDFAEYGARPNHGTLGRG
jgi:hypothetical protein